MAGNPEESAESGPRRPMPKFEDAVVRKGFPSSPLTDLYYKMLKGSWLLVLGVFGLAYLAANLVFALIFVASGDCIAGAEPGSFADAFAFSVQTLSTIGYGAMSPKTELADTVVLIESMVGLLGVALATGLCFAKFARPRANVRFTRNVLVSPYDGRRCLYFRVANVRGNDVVEASVRVAALTNLVTAEGHTLRRLSELKLVRDRSPLFRLSWLVIHVIDEGSPLHGMELDDLFRERTVFIVSLTGMDGTFAQTVHARHVYLPQDVVFDHHFEDIITELDDGRMEFDFGKFHAIHRLSARQLAEGEREDLEEEESELLDAEAEERCAVQRAEDETAAE